jgi:hypothetical protein
MESFGEFGRLESDLSELERGGDDAYHFCHVVIEVVEVAWPSRIRLGSLIPV